jgi:hypothetical protein
MGLFSRGRPSGRERRAMRNHLSELDDLRRKNLAELGRMTVEMAGTGSFERRLLSDKAGEVVSIDHEADLVARGIEEGLSLEELEEMARQEDSPSSASGK